MLDTWIIEELKRREELEKEESRPQLELPIPPSDWRPPEKPEDSKRGVCIINLLT